MPRYICVGCGGIHNDTDYCKSDGDILLDENTVKCLIQFIDKEYEANLKKYSDARRSFELQQTIVNKLKFNTKCVKSQEKAP